MLCAMLPDSADGVADRRCGADCSERFHGGCSAHLLSGGHVAEYLSVGCDTAEFGACQFLHNCCRRNWPIAAHSTKNRTKSRNKTYADAVYQRHTVLLCIASANSRDSCGTQTAVLMRRTLEHQKRSRTTAFSLCTSCMAA